MTKKHLVFIINPRSGVDRIKAIQAAIESTLDKAQYSYEIQHTQRAKHGTELAREASQKGAYAVVAVGGDGSVNDIVAGLLNTNTILAIIPKGSGNGMARAMKIPLKVTEAIAVINKGNITNMDVAFANGQPFISNAGVAFDALISRKFAKSVRRGLAMYSWLITKHMWTYKEWEWDVTIDGQPLKSKAFMITIANGQQLGYNFKIAPHASWTDGELDVVIIRRFPKILGGALVLRALSGSIIKSPFVQHFKAKNITISHPELRLMQTDGDAHECDNKINFHIQAGAQRIITP
jgi:YegS/Rv2252/BmrU family lipid kinase